VGGREPRDEHLTVGPVSLVDPVDPVDPARRAVGWRCDAPTSTRGWACDSDRVQALGSDSVALGGGIARDRRPPGR